jgi:hypothetical protein
LASSRREGVVPEAARRALDAVERDASARAILIAAYDGDGDAVTALRDRVVPDAAAAAARDRELDALRRAAFGRTSTSAEAVRAAEAHALLASADERRADDGRALDRAIAAVLAVPADPSPHPARATHPGSPPAPRRRRLPALWALGGFALGAGIVAAVVAALPSAALDTALVTPGALAIPPGADETEARRGDVEAAERWLQRAWTAADAIPVPLEDIDPASTRLVSGGSSDGAVWVAREVDGGLCLVVAASVDGAYASSCATPEEFAERGAMVAVNEGMAGVPSIGATWDGAHVYLTVGSE